MFKCINIILLEYKKNDKRVGDLRNVRRRREAVEQPVAMVTSLNERGFFSRAERL